MGKELLIGFLLGLFLASAGAAVGAAVTGGNGFLEGWVVTRGTELVCEHPFLFVNKRQIDCQ